MTFLWIVWIIAIYYRYNYVSGVNKIVENILWALYTCFVFRYVPAATNDKTPH